MRLRLRQEPDADYQVLRSNAKWWEHQARMYATAGLIAFLAPDSVLDLACGDGSLVFTANRLRRIKKATFVDISKPSIDFVIETALGLELKASASVIDAEKRLDIAIAANEHWDMVLACEFLEHVPDPAMILVKARAVAQILVASSPLVDGSRGDPNPEHLWAFDNEGYLELFAESGWSPKICENLMLHEGYYNFQMWVCEHG